MYTHTHTQTYIYIYIYIYIYTYIYVYDDDDCFITFNSSLVPLIEGQCSSNPWEFEFLGF